MAQYNIIGRKQEIEELEHLLESDKSEFLAIYGRRRVGKSFLIEEVYGKKMAFSTVGLYFNKEDRPSLRYRQEQLAHFYESLIQYGLSENENCPNNWLEAFRLLRKLLEANKSKRKVIFLDELPWLAGPQSSEFVAELGYFWNSWAARQRNIVLVVCGSATSWMLDNVIRDYGGLYNRLTMKMQLLPFTLGECEQYYKKKGFRMSRYEMAIAYMVLGGIPYYMDMLRNNKSLTENINHIFFDNANIKQEFEDVYVGLFSSSERYLDIIRLLGKNRYGITRAEIAESLKMKSGGGLSTMLDNLLQSGIIRNYIRLGSKRKENVYQLYDFFSLFYLKVIEGNGKNSWEKMQRSSRFFAWAGITFEQLVISHQKQLMQALNIGDQAVSYCWNGIQTEGEGPQIDLVIEWHNNRTDYLCEIKFSETAFQISADYQRNLLDKIYAFSESHQHNKTHSILLVMVTTMGMKKGMYTSTVNSEVTLDDLFR